MLAFPLSASPTLNEVFARAIHALGWPARVLEQRAVRERLAALSERERQDIGGVRLEAVGRPAPETPAERRARRIAIRAWYGHGAEAA